MRRGLRVAAALGAVYLVVGVGSAMASVAPTTIPDRLDLRGRIGGEASGTLRLIASSDATDVIVTAGPLDMQNGSDHLEASAVTISPAEKKLEPGRPADITVTVKGFRFVGVYSGTITIEYAAVVPAPSGGAASPPSFGARTVDLTVLVSDDPKVELAFQTAPLKIAKTYCFDDHPIGSLDCLLANAFLDDVEVSHDYRVTLQNNAQSPATIDSAIWTSVRRETNQTVVPGALSVGLPGGPIPNSARADLTLSYKATDVDPGTYDGAVSYSVSGLPIATQYITELTVRRGPLLPILLLMVGVALVFGFAWLGDRRTEIRAGKEGAKNLKSLYDKANADDKQLVKDAYAKLAGKAAKGWTPGDVSAAANVATNLETLRIVRHIARDIGDDSRFRITRGKIQEAREQVEQNDPKTAATAADQAIEAWAQESQLPKHMEIEARASYLVEPQRSRGARGSVDRFLKLLGVRPQSWTEVRSTTITTAWATVRFLSLTAIVFAGLKLLYFDNPTYSGGFLEAVAFLGYGISSDAIARLAGGFFKKA